MNTKIFKGAVISGVINGVINGVIQWFSFSKYESVPISVDSITNNDFTVLGEAVHLGVTLAMILTFFAFFSIPKGSRPPISKRVWLIIKHGFFSFGVITGLAVLWQYNVGTVEVGPFIGVLLVALIAGIVAAVVNYLTIEPYMKASDSDEGDS